MSTLTRQVLQVAAGLGVVAMGLKVFSLPAASRVMVFRVVWLGILPLPIPVGFFTSPHFWGGLLMVAGGVVVFAALRSRRR